MWISLARLAKLAGAPDRQAAGVYLKVRLGDVVGKGDPLLYLHAQTPGEMSCALGFARDAEDIIRVEIEPSC